jgi:LuxR family maltose regulon positive regulatory protein
VVARNTPHVDGAILVGRDGAVGNITVGSPAWYAWLEDASTFAFASAQGSFTARKERSGRTGWYWKAYRKQKGTLHRTYLGKSADLTLDRLNAIASELAQRGLGSPHQSSDVISPTAADDEPRRQVGAALPTGTVTFLFTDIESSSQLWEQHKQAMPATLARHDAILRHTIETHSGVVFKTVGDSAHAVFARAADALSAALAAQRALRAEPWGATGPPRVRMALHTGAAELRDGDYFGSPLNRVARILALGHGGQTLLSRATHDLVADDLPSRTSLRDLGEQPLKDLSRPEQIFQLVSPDLPSDFPPLRTLDQSPEAAPVQPSLLLRTKLYIPLPRPHLVPRGRLVERMQAGQAGKLTLIVAPAGFGKTTLVSAWIAARTAGRGLRAESVAAAPSPQSSALGIGVAWVSLDTGDNDTTRFWSYVIAALETVYPAVGTTAMALLRSPQPPAIEVILTPLLNAISALPIDGALILDDYHLIDTPAIHMAMAFLLDHLPPHVHVIMITRADPPLQLTRLRTRGELTEVRAADLRFTTDEAAAFLSAAMGVSLSAAEVTALGQRTEGWIAGLQFAALAMRDRSDRASFIEAFTGSNRFVVDYLAEEVLARQPPHLLMFLLQTSILDRLCGPLCDAVLGLGAWDLGLEGDVQTPSSKPQAPQAYSQLMLDELERANVFLITLDDNRRWYRYHHLFADVLRGRLASGASGVAVATLHARASAWFEQQGLEVEAVAHALAAGDWELAARLIEQCAWPVAFRGQVHTVLGWFNGLPAPLILARPTLAVLHALILMHTDQLDAAESRLQDAERGLPPDTPEEQARPVQGMILTTRANISFYQGDLPRCVALAQQALDLLPETASLPRVASMAFVAHSFLVTGDATPATGRQVAAVAPAARAAGNRFVVLRGLTLLAQLQVLQGRLHAAAAIYREAAQLAPEPGGLQSMVGSAGYYFGLGDLCREWNDLAAAEQLLVDGMDRTVGVRTANAIYFGLGFVALARLQHASGDQDGARATLGRFAELGRQRGFDALVLARGLAVRAQLALAQGDLDAAVQWADTSGLHADDLDLPFPREAEYLSFARTQIALQRHNGGRRAPLDIIRLLDRLLAAAEASGRMGSVIEILIVRALALNAQGELSGALAALERALRLAEPEGYVRIFVDEAAPMAALLARVVGHGSPVAAYAASLLTAFPDELRIEKVESRNPSTTNSQFSILNSQLLVEPLTEREIEILRLIAAGSSNQAIADTLVIAISTVKRHINNIYGKLDVQSRTQALVRGRELNLL